MTDKNKSLTKKKNRDTPKIFLGKDKETFGEEGTGWIEYDPDFECGGPPGTPDRLCPFPAREDDMMGFQTTGSAGRKLHIAIASFRDPLCPKTLFNLFTKAKKPNDIIVRVLQQNDPNRDPDCLKTYCNMMAKNGMGSDTDCPHSDQVFIHDIHFTEASGPTWARGLLSQDIATAYNNKELHPQDFCMSTDAHMDFEPDWDESMVHMWDLAENEYAVLSTYVVNTDQLGKNLHGLHEVPHLCMVEFTSEVRTDATKCARMLPKPKLTNAVWGAGLSYSKCHAELKVPVDPHTPHIFDGEEFNRAARFFTYGYDIYTPHRVYVLHDYMNSQSNPINGSWSRNTVSHGSAKDSHYRLHHMIGMNPKDTDEDIKLRKSKYGLGDRRTLEQLVEFSGVDLRRQRFPVDGKNRCGNIRWVPFVEHPKGVNFVPSFDKDTEEPLDPYDETSVWYDAGEAVHGVVAAPDANSETSESLEEKKKNNVAKQMDADMEKVHASPILQGENEEKDMGDDDDGSANADGGAHPAVHVDLHQRHAELGDVIREHEEAALEAAKPVLSNAEANAMAAMDGIAVGGSTSKNIRGRILHDGDTAKRHGLLIDLMHRPPHEHGLRHLPLPIQISVGFLVLGVVFVIYATAGTGRAAKFRKMALRRKST